LNPPAILAVCHAFPRVEPDNSRAILYQPRASSPRRPRHASAPMATGRGDSRVAEPRLTRGRRNPPATNLPPARPRKIHHRTPARWVG